jgi:hypothetical protein
MILIQSNLGGFQDSGEVVLEILEHHVNILWKCALLCVVKARPNTVTKSQEAKHVSILFRNMTQHWRIHEHLKNAFEETRQKLVAGKYTDYTTENKIICDSNQARDVGGLNYVISRCNWRDT